MPEYVISKLASGNWSIAKFDWTSEPLAVYEVRLTAKGLRCSCPQDWRAPGACKHVRMVKDKLAQETHA